MKHVVRTVSHPTDGVATAARVDAAIRGETNVGAIIHHLRTKQGLTLRQLAEATGVSASFLGQLERGETDVALGRLSRIAEVFGHDVGSLLGYTERRTRPQYVSNTDRFLVDRGPGVRYEILRVRGTGMELVLAEFAPGAACLDELVHEGIDVLVLERGELVLSLDGVDYPIHEAQCVAWSGSYRHRLKNESNAVAIGVMVTTDFY